MLGVHIVPGVVQGPADVPDVLGVFLRRGPLAYARRLGCVFHLEQLLLVVTSNQTHTNINTTTQSCFYVCVLGLWQILRNTVSYSIKIFATFSLPTFVVSVFATVYLASWRTQN